MLICWTTGVIVLVEPAGFGRDIDAQVRHQAGERRSCPSQRNRDATAAMTPISRSSASKIPHDVEPRRVIGDDRFRDDRDVVSTHRSFPIGANRTSVVAENRRTDANGGITSSALDNHSAAKIRSFRPSLRHTSRGRSTDSCRSPNPSIIGSAGAGAAGGWPRQRGEEWALLRSARRGPRPSAVMAEGLAQAATTGFIAGWDRDMPTTRPD